MELSWISVGVASKLGPQAQLSGRLTMAKEVSANQFKDSLSQPCAS